jgi:hypothetical protein
MIARLVQRLDNSAFTNAAVTAFHDHSTQLFAQRRKLRDAPIDLREMSPRDRVYFLAWTVRLAVDRKEFANVSDFESKVTRVPDKVQPRNIVSAITPLLALGPCG